LIATDDSHTIQVSVQIANNPNMVNASVQGSDTHIYYRAVVDPNNLGGPFP